MSHDRLTAIIRHHAQVQVNRLGTMRIADIDGYIPGDYIASIILQPEGYKVPSVPIMSPFIGSGWGLAMGLLPGDQVFVFCQEGDAECPVIMGCCYSDQQRPPTAQGGEFVLVHQSGASLKFLNDGTVQGSGPMTWTGNINCTGTITCPQAVIGGVPFTTHEHTGVTRGDDTSAGPVVPGGGVGV